MSSWESRTTVGFGEGAEGEDEECSNVKRDGDCEDCCCC